MLRHIPRLLFSLPLALAGPAAKAADAQTPWGLFSAAEWRVAAGPGLLVGPRYPGAARYRVLPIPALEARNGQVFLSGRDGLGVDLFNRGGARLAAAAFARFGRAQSDDAALLSGLPDIDPAPQARVIAERAWDRFRVRAVAARDLGGGDGTTLDLDAGLPARLGNRVTLSAGPQASLGDGRFMRTYFGVAQSGTRPGYSAHAGLYQAGAGASAFARLDRRWIVTATVAVNRLIGAAARSPVVGARTQATGGVFLAYSFGPADPKPRVPR